MNRLEKWITSIVMGCMVITMVCHAHAQDIAADNRELREQAAAIWESGDRDSAFTHLIRATAQASTVADPYERAAMLIQIARVYHLHGERAEALILFDRAYKDIEQIPSLPSRIEALHGLLNDQRLLNDREAMTSTMLSMARDGLPAQVATHKEMESITALIAACDGWLMPGEIYELAHSFSAIGNDNVRTLLLRSLTELRFYQDDTSRTSDKIAADMVGLWPAVGRIEPIYIQALAARLSGTAESRMHWLMKAEQAAERLEGRERRETLGTLKRVWGAM